MNVDLVNYDKVCIDCGGDEAICQITFGDCQRCSPKKEVGDA